MMKASRASAVWCLPLLLLGLAAPLRGGVFLAAARLPWAVVNQPYAAPPLLVTVNGECAQPGAYTRVVSGRLPDGITLDAMGHFSGVPSARGRWLFVVEARNGCAWARQQYALEVTPAPVLMIHERRLEFDWKVGTPPPAVRSVAVSATWPELPYMVLVPEEARWLRAQARAGLTPPARNSALEADVVNIAIQPEGIAPGTYQAELRLSAWQAPHAAAIEIVLRVVK